MFATRTFLMFDTDPRDLCQTCHLCFYAILLFWSQLQKVASTFLLSISLHQGCAQCMSSCSELARLPYHRSTFWVQVLSNSTRVIPIGFQDTLTKTIDFTKRNSIVYGAVDIQLSLIEGYTTCNTGVIRLEPIQNYSMQSPFATARTTCNLVISSKFLTRKWRAWTPSSVENRHRAVETWKWDWRLISGRQQVYQIDIGSYVIIRLTDVAKTIMMDATILQS